MAHMSSQAIGILPDPGFYYIKTIPQKPDSFAAIIFSIGSQDSVPNFCEKGEQIND